MYHLSWNRSKTRNYSQRPVRNVEAEGQVVYTQQSMFGMVRNVQTCPDCNGYW